MNEDFYIQIKNILYRKKISQTELAQRIGIAKSTLNSYLNGKTEMPLSVGVIIAKELHLDLNSIYDISSDRVIIDELENSLLVAFRDVPTKDRAIVARSIINLIKKK